VTSSAQNGEVPLLTPKPLVLTTIVWGIGTVAQWGLSTYAYVNGALSGGKEFEPFFLSSLSTLIFLVLACFSITWKEFLQDMLAEMTFYKKTVTGTEGMDPSLFYKAGCIGCVVVQALNVFWVGYRCAAALNPT
jgi:hypothetical protein